MSGFLGHGSAHEAKEAKAGEEGPVDEAVGKNKGWKSGGSDRDQREVERLEVEREREVKVLLRISKYEERKHTFGAQCLSESHPPRILEYWVQL